MTKLRCLALGVLKIAALKQVSGAVIDVDADAVLFVPTVANRNAPDTAPEFRRCSLQLGNG